MTTKFSTTMTPDGAFTILTRDDAVLASGWTDDVAALISLIHPSLRPRHAATVAAGMHDRAMRSATLAVEAHYDGDFTAVADVPVLQASGPFLTCAWEVLRGVTAGTPITYSEFAARAGSPSAVRAAAAACARNAAALFVPCHRVLRSDGTLGGFRYGLDLKQRLLERETLVALPLS
ncbi:MAG: methylated-DNA--[protein]-cysteine S-methyltransferase [Propionibacteriaceae bacterium]|nr:methylated-DNA--[protein]-cysteine S-methyltransferase [Propionibacteriaceae bacterium]